MRLVKKIAMCAVFSVAALDFGHHVANATIVSEMEHDCENPEGQRTAPEICEMLEHHTHTFHTDMHPMTHEDAHELSEKLEETNTWLRALCLSGPCVKNWRQVVSQNERRMQKKQPQKQGE